MPENKNHWPTCSDWAFLHTPHPKDTHQLFYLLQITRKIQFPGLLSAQAPKSLKHSKKAQKLPVTDLGTKGNTVSLRAGAQMMDATTKESPALL